jgi:lipopolysaccharide exporter
MKVAVILPEFELYDSLKGGAIAKWVYNIYSRSDFPYVIFGIALVQDKYKVDTKFINLNSVFIRVFKRVPVIRRIVGLLYILKCKRYLNDYDVVHLHNSFYLIEYLRKFGYTEKIILHLHNNFLDKLSKEKIEYLKENVTEFVFCSKAILKTSGVTGKVIYNGYDHNYFYFKTRSNRDTNLNIGFVARIDHNKGLHALLLALRDIKKNVPNVILHIAGNESNPRKLYERRMIKMISGLNKEFGNFIVLHGKLEHRELGNLYRKLDCLYAFSLDREAFGMNLIECLASGTPVMVNMIGGVREAVVRDSFQIKDNSVESIVTRVIEHRMNKEFWKNEVIIASGVIESVYNWKAIARDWKKILLAL